MTGTLVDLSRRRDACAHHARADQARDWDVEMVVFAHAYGGTFSPDDPCTAVGRLHVDLDPTRLRYGVTVIPEGWRRLELRSAWREGEPLGTTLRREGFTDTMRAMLCALYGLPG